MDTLILTGSMLFLSTLSLRRATAVQHSQIHKHNNFYPRSPCGERLHTCQHFYKNILISIHALLAESDLSSYSAKTMNALFLSTLSLRRATREPTALRTPHHKFLSTLSLRRATLLPQPTPRPLPNFYPRSPCGERRSVSNTVTPPSPFLSTLSLRRATKVMEIGVRCLIFLSTLSLRRATLRVLDGSKSSIISIHALLAESDYNSGLSAYFRHISIHALLAESDCRHNSLPPFAILFLSTLSLRRATVPCWALYSSSRYFYPRSPCGERPPQIKMMGAPVDNFYPRSPCGERRWAEAIAAKIGHFYPRSPCGERR